MTNEEIWNHDLIKILEEELKDEFPRIKIFKGKVLKDIFLNKDKDSKKGKIQFGFVDQDIVFYEDEMDISELNNIENILVHNNNVGNKNQMIIPKLICELKYNGINSHGLITYSEIASDIKSIFPECRYWLVMRFRKSSTENKLKRHGKNFNKIIFFDEGKSEGKYTSGDFKKQLNQQAELKIRFSEFLKEIKMILGQKETFFVK